MIDPIPFRDRYWSPDDHADGSQLECLHCPQIPAVTGFVFTLDRGTRLVVAALADGGSKFRRHYDETGKVYTDPLQ